MYASFYIFTIAVIIVASILLWLKPKSLAEHFLTNTIELSDYTLQPLRFDYTTDISREFLEALSSYVPLKGNRQYPEFKIMPKSLAIYSYFKSGYEDYRYVSNLYTVYLTMITNKDSQVYTYEDLLVMPGLTIYYLDQEMERLMNTLFPNPNLPKKYVASLPNKLAPADIYCFWETEYSTTLNHLAKNNKFIIIKMPEHNDIYSWIQIDYPNLVPQKYDISLQKSINTERVIYSLEDNVSIITDRGVKLDRVYTLIKSIFKHIVDIRTSVKSERAKYVLEYLRPENLIEIALIPYHPGVEKYFWELEVYTNKADPICVNTISTIPCQPLKLFDNRYRMILYGSNG